MIGAIHKLEKINILWENDKIKGSNNCVDLEVKLDKEVCQGDLLLLTSGKLLFVAQSKFSRFKNMPHPKMGGQVIRVTSVINEKTILEW